MIYGNAGNGEFNYHYIKCSTVLHQLIIVSKNLDEKLCYDILKFSNGNFGLVWEKTAQNC